MEKAKVKVEARTGTRARVRAKEVGILKARTLSKECITAKLVK